MSLQITNLSELTTLVTNANSFFQLPVGNTSQRPVSPEIGTIRYNIDITHVEIFTETGWKYLDYGEKQFTVPGTYIWTVPAMVTSICGVCIGGGGTGGYGPNASGGGGGGLHWRNDIPVTPGQNLTVVVGDRGGNSYIQNGGLDLMRATGGGDGSGSQNVGSYGGRWVNMGSGNEGGGYGGDGGGIANGGATGGGGAAGYTGNGGSTYYIPNGGIIGANAGTGGGGGGGFGSKAFGPAGNGGGVGIFGQGTSGNAGQPGSNGTGSYYGGGGGGYKTSGSTSGVGSSGASGAVRIIWGMNRSFPFNS